VTARKCPICAEPVPPRPANQAFPFCSPRCRMIDLGKWLDEDYRVPTNETPDADVDPDEVM
jgi:endogenous inhibitor of DNA gyrase (YacG/DUF329 family)